MTVIDKWKLDEAVDAADLFAVAASTNDAGWEDLAACRAEPGAVDVFFSEELTDIVEAKRICAECPVIAPCLEGAIARAEPCGVWGGQLFSNGRILTQKRRRGRPPKVARPEDQLPVVPVPDHLQRLIA
jgi:WhiB family redox-sensing transcriptional regulator